MTDKLNFQDFFPKNWYQEQEESSFWIRIYTMIFVSHSQITKLIDTVPSEIIEDDILVWFRGVGMSASKLPGIESNFIHSNPETGGPICPVENKSKDLPLSSYFIIGSPLIIDGKNLGEGDTIKRLNRAEAIVSSYSGSNSLHELVFEGEYSANIDGKHNFRGEERIGEGNPTTM